MPTYRGPVIVREVGDRHGRSALYLHGTASTPDDGPGTRLAAEEGIRLLLVDRPGYRGTPATPSASLIDVAREAVAAVKESAGVTSLVTVGWSGGGPYALAAAVAAPSTVTGVGLLASWAPMEPPHPRLPRPVRVFMRLGQVLPRPLLRGALAAVGRTTAGQVDDVRRVARAWGFSVDQATQTAVVRVWHAEDDREVPVEPWRTEGIALRTRLGGDHDPADEVWREVFEWVKTV